MTTPGVGFGRYGRRLHPGRPDRGDAPTDRGRRADRQAEPLTWARPPMSSLALIGLGSNLGDRAAMLDGAIAALAATPGVCVAPGQLVSTRPSRSADRPGRGPTSTPPRRSRRRSIPSELLRVLQAIEDAVRPGPDRPLGRADARPRFAPLRRSDHRLARVDRPPSPARRTPVRPGAAGRDRPGSRRPRDRADDVRAAGRAGTGLHLGRFTLTRCQACGVVATRRKAGPTPRDRLAEGVFRGKGSHEMQGR